MIDLSPDKKSTMKVFDAVANLYRQRWFSLNDAAKSHIVTHRAKCSVDFSRLNSDDLVLEVGCGLGIPRVLSDVSMKLYVGLDISRRMLGTATITRDSWVNWIVADAEQLPFCNKVFSKAIALETLEHLENPYLALREMMRVVQLDGIIAVSVPSTFSNKVFNRILKLFEIILHDSVRSKMSQILSGNMIENQFSSLSLMKMFRLRGMREIGTRRVGFCIPYRARVPLSIILLLERFAESLQLPICAGIICKGKNP